MADLSRFHEAQARDYDTALAELKAGSKRSHWIWYILPQLGALGRSERAKFYGIADLAEARAYLADPVLNARLAECARTLLSHPIRSAEEMLGPVDAQKLLSSATLFSAAGRGTPTGALMQDLIERFHFGQTCRQTQELLKADPSR